MDDKSQINIASGNGLVVKSNKPLTGSYIEQVLCHHMTSLLARVQKKCNSSADALELRLCCTEPSIWYRSKEDLFAA